jgi:hypothetical protein
MQKHMEVPLQPLGTVLSSTRSHLITSVNLKHTIILLKKKSLVSIRSQVTGLYGPVWKCMGSVAKRKKGCLRSRGVTVGPAEVVGCSVAVNKIDPGLTQRDPKGSAYTPSLQIADVKKFQAFRYAKREIASLKDIRDNVDSCVVATAHYY